MAGTVADNVTFGRWGEKPDLARVEDICRRAAMDFVFSHPRGVNQPLGQGGSGVSGGQAQKVAIARALYINPEVVVFDEATSALDGLSENAIKETVAGLPGDTTAIIIAHRLDTVRDCDRLVWLDRGRIFATGRPEEIIPRYQATWQEEKA
jgi:ABC-type multidrug transport system fused ATPase/permease subunit